MLCVKTLWQGSGKNIQDYLGGKIWTCLNSGAQRDIWQRAALTDPMHASSRSWQASFCNMNTAIRLFTPWKKEIIATTRSWDCTLCFSGTWSITPPLMQQRLFVEGKTHWFESVCVFIGVWECYYICGTGCVKSFVAPGGAAGNLINAHKDVTESEDDKPEEYGVRSELARPSSPPPYLCMTHVA